MAPINNLPSSIQNLLSDNSKEVFLGASEVLLRLANNVVNNPDNPKYRKLRVGNALVQSKLLPVVGAMECLFEMGFQEDGEFLTLPQEASLANIRDIRNQLNTQRSKLQGPQTSPFQARPNAASQAASGNDQQEAAAAAASPSPQPPQTIQQISTSQLQFYSKLKGGLDHVLIYEDPRQQEKARSFIPLSELRQKAKAKYEEMKSVDTADQVDVQDMLLLELLAWFKNDFFKWVDAPPCDSCDGRTTNVGTLPPEPAESMWGAGRVENYRCNVCSRFTRFPRYNHPSKLLDTRKGRCGEWANCFTLCCISVGFEARHVLDWTDHVWTEVFSQKQKRWLHCDPCENKCDKPLMYESGWGKKLSYIIAFSKDGIQDVSWRYSSKHAELRSRRTEVSETWLVNTITRMRQDKMKVLPEDRKKILVDRLLTELVEFMSVKTSGEGEHEGRTTGSLAWRLARGEVGEKTPPKTGPVVIKPTSQEITNKLLHIKYSCATDTYIRVSSGAEKTPGWQSLVHHFKDIIRKEEQDWQMVYLARAEGTQTAVISWKIDLKESGMVIDTVEIKGEESRFENGQVMWRICSEEQCSFLPPGGTMTTVEGMQGAPDLTLTAHLRGGNGNCAWQHTQLFRQKLGERDNFPLEIKITLKEK